MSRNFELLQRAIATGQKAQETTPGLTPVDFKQTTNVPSYAVVIENTGNRIERVRSEEVRKLVQRAFLFPGAPRSVVFAATEHENTSSSWLCASASEALAGHVAGTVCIVDANRGLPSLHAHCGVENHVGLSDCVLNDGPILQFTQQVRDNLFLMPFGTNTAEWPTVLTSSRMRTRISELRENFDHVIFYAAPVGRFPDAMLLGQLVDGIILIIEADHTKRQEARRAKETIESANVRLLGAVLDNRKFPIPESIYRYL